MSGHSKWHNIRLRKGKQDAERGKTFTKLAREIIVAAKDGGGNADSNIRLRIAVQKARESSMPADNIKRAIQRGTGEIEGAIYDEVTYEGYGPAGVAVMVACLTDNRNRTVADVRSYCSKCGGSLGETRDPRGDVPQPVDVLDGERIGQAEVMHDAHPVRRGHPRVTLHAEDGHQRIAGQNAQHDKDHERHPDEGSQGEQRPPSKVLAHR